MGTLGMGKLSSAIFRHLSHYDAILPYNLNWQRRDWSLLAEFFGKEPIHVLDVGARGGAIDELSSLKRFCDYIAFDADSEEASRLNLALARGIKNYRVHPKFVGGTTGHRTFYIYKNPGESSSRLPNPEYKKFSPNLDVDHAVDVDLTTLNEMGTNGDLDDVDFLKLDTQGTEYEILAAADWALARALMVEVEVEFVEIYSGQKLVFDIHRFLHERGFVFLYLNRAFIGRADYRGPTRGQLVFGDALFGLSESKARLLPVEKLIKYIVLLTQYGHMDFAHALYQGSPIVRREYPQLERLFKPHAGRWARYARLAVSLMDKLVLLLLHARKTNHLQNDSDRSWPVR